MNNILFIGLYHKDSVRNAVFLKGLKQKGIKIYEFNVKSYGFIKNCWKCIKEFKKMNSFNFDIILLHNPTTIQLILAKILSLMKKKPLIHDIFISKLQTYYYDRKLFGKNKLPKVFYWILYYLKDLVECLLADKIILDTYSHIKYFHDRYRIPIKKFRRIFVGAQDDIFFPIQKKKDNEEFIVGFWGTFIPVHGIQSIIRAAKLLENEERIRFKLIGDGQTYNDALILAKELKLKNIDFWCKNFITQNQLNILPEVISKFDISLGIFGNTAKASQVIPTKIFEGFAMKLAMITMDCPAIREMLTDGKNIILCEPANPKSLAEAILLLKNDSEMRESIKNEAFKLFKQYWSIEAISTDLLNYLNFVLKPT